MKIAGIVFFALAGVLFLIAASGRSGAGPDAAVWNVGAAGSAAVGALLLAVAKRRNQ